MHRGERIEELCMSANFLADFIAAPDLEVFYKIDQQEADYMKRLALSRWLALVTKMNFSLRLHEKTPACGRSLIPVQ